MNIDNKMLMELAEQLGMDNGNQEKKKGATGLADQYKDKSDEEIMNEIMKVKKTLKNDKAQFDKQLKTIKALRVMMNEDQKARLDMIIRLLESEDE